MRGADGDAPRRAAVHGDAIWVTSTARSSSSTSSAAAPAPAAGAIRTRCRRRCPATVVRIAVKPGDRVSQGDLLVALEAMKMELPIRAPRDGVVPAIHCAEGDLVQPGTPLVDMD